MICPAQADEDVGAPASQAARQQLARALAVGGSVEMRPSRHGGVGGGAVIALDDTRAGTRLACCRRPLETLNQVKTAEQPVR